MTKTVRNITLLSTGVALILGLRQVASSFKNDITYSLPINKLGASVRNWALRFQPTLVVKNHGNISGSLENVKAVVRLNRGNGFYTTLATTNPSSKRYELKSTQVHEFKLPEIEINAMGFISAGREVVKAITEQNGLVEIIVSGYANGVPFSTKQVY